MGIDAFKPLREAKDEIVEKVEDISLRRQALKDERLLARLTEIGGRWRNGPLSISVGPAYFGTQGVSMTDLASRTEFASKYPELEEPLAAEKFDKISPIIIGRIDIGNSKTGESGFHEKYMRDGKSVIFAGAELLKDTRAAFQEAAKSIQGGESPLSDVDYFIGVSRLGSVAGHLGFDMFPLSKETGHDHQSHEYAKEANLLSGMESTKAAEKATKRPATLAVISKKKFLELYGQ